MCIFSFPVEVGATDFFSRPVQASTELLLPSNATYSIVLVTINLAKKKWVPRSAAEFPPRLTHDWLCSSRSTTIHDSSPAQKHAREAGRPSRAAQCIQADTVCAKSEPLKRCCFPLRRVKKQKTKKSRLPAIHVTCRMSSSCTSAHSPSEASPFPCRRRSRRALPCHNNR